MKAIIFATIATCLSFAIATIVLRLWRIERRAFVLIIIYILCLILLIVSDQLTTDDLTILAKTLLATPRWFNLMSSIFFFTAAFFGGVLQLYNLADRGLSLRILIDLAEHPLRKASADYLVENYGGGRGIAWLYNKRINDMTSSGLIEVDGNNIRLTNNRGEKLARAFRVLSRLFSVVEK